MSAPRMKRSLARLCAVGVTCSVGAAERSAHADAAVEFDATSSVGFAFNDGLPAGVYARPELDFFFYFNPNGSAQPLVGYAIGPEVWSAPGSAGLGLPVLLKGGLRFGARAGLPGFSSVLRLGVGVSVFQLDAVTPLGARGPTTGGGIYAPTIASDLAFGTLGFRLGVEARLSYRWEWVIEDRMHVQLGLAMSFPVRVMELD